MGAQAIRNDIADSLKQLTLQGLQLNNLILQQPKGETSRQMLLASDHLQRARQHLAAALGMSQSTELKELANETENPVNNQRG
jgi:hypothetical protein